MEKKVEEYRNIQHGKWKTSLTSLPLPTPPPKPLLMMVYLNVLHYDLLWQFQQQQGEEKKKNYIETKLENSIPPPNPWFHFPRFQ